MHSAREVETIQATAGRLLERASSASADLERMWREFGIGSEEPAATGGASETMGDETCPTVGSDVWEGLLEWALRATRADCCFVLDAKGLTVALRGDPGELSIEGVGTHLSGALGGVERVGLDRSSAGSALLDLGDTWVSGFGARSPSGDEYLLGVLGGEQLRGETRSKLHAAFERSLRDLASPPHRRAG